jgi:hypothetical protein
VTQPSECGTQGADVGVPPAVVKYRQDDAGRLSRLGELPAGCGGGRERLVRHDMHAGRDGFQHEFAARWWWRRDRHDVDSGIEQGVLGVVDGDSRAVLAELRAALRVAGHDAGELEPVGRLDERSMEIPAPTP